MRLHEIRSNPDKNPKARIIDELRKFKDRDNVFVTFTELNKLGVNPQSKYDTPIGIYAYPVKELWERYVEPNLDRISVANNMRHIVPFAGEKPYAILFEVTDLAGIMVGTQNFTQQDFDEKIARLRDYVESLIGDYLSKTETSYNVSELVADTVKASEHAATRNSLFGRFWYVTYTLSHEVLKFLTYKRDHQGEKRLSIRDNRHAILWNKLMRESGINGFVDTEGQGIIHLNEPMQAVFFTKENLRVIDVLENKIRPDIGNIRYKASTMMMRMVFRNLEQKLLTTYLPKYTDEISFHPQVGLVIYWLKDSWETYWLSNREEITREIGRDLKNVEFRVCAEDAHKRLSTNRYYRDIIAQAIKKYRIQNDSAES